MLGKTLKVNPLMAKGKLISHNQGKANILNKQFKVGFFFRCIPLRLSQLWQNTLDIM